MADGKDVDIERIVGFFKREKKMVAFADNHSPASSGAFSAFYGIVGGCAFYLHFILSSYYA